MRDGASARATHVAAGEVSRCTGKKIVTKPAPAWRGHAGRLRHGRRRLSTARRNPAIAAVRSAGVIVVTEVDAGQSAWQGGLAAATCVISHVGDTPREDPRRVSVTRSPAKRARRAAGGVTPTSGRRQCRPCRRSLTRRSELGGDRVELRRSRCTRSVSGRILCRWLPIGSAAGHRLCRTGAIRALASMPAATCIAAASRPARRDGTCQLLDYLTCAMKTDELREKYLAFFESKGCVRRPSDVLVPRWDPSVLFTPAGMNQFKDHFLGKLQARIHPGHDLPEMPAHRRHRQRRPHRLSPHVLRDAGQLQLRRLFQARSDPLGLGVPDRPEMARPRPPIGCRSSVYLDDDEAADIWTNEIKLPPDRIERMGEDDNFWPAGAPSQGPDGVCGPCSEIFYPPPTRRRGRDLEPGVHAVQSRRLAAQQSPPAAEQEHRHRHGAGADRRGAARRRHQFPHRHPAAARRGGRPKSAASRTIRPAKTAAGCGASPTTSGPARSPFTRTSIPGPNKEKYVVKPTAAPGRARRPSDGRSTSRSCTSWCRRSPR